MSLALPETQQPGATTGPATSLTPQDRLKAARAAHDTVLSDLARELTGEQTLEKIWAGRPRDVRQRLRHDAQEGGWFAVLETLYDDPGHYGSLKRDGLPWLLSTSKARELARTFLERLEAAEAELETSHGPFEYDERGQVRVTQPEADTPDLDEPDG